MGEKIYTDRILIFVKKAIGYVTFDGAVIYASDWGHDIFSGETYAKL